MGVSSEHDTGHSAALMSVAGVVFTSFILLPPQIIHTSLIQWSDHHSPPFSLVFLSRGLYIMITPVASPQQKAYNNNNDKTSHWLLDYLAFFFIFRWKGIIKSIKSHSSLVAGRLVSLERWHNFCALKISSCVVPSDLCCGSVQPALKSESLWCSQATRSIYKSPPAPAIRNAKNFASGHSTDELEVSSVSSSESRSFQNAEARLTYAI